MTRVHEPKQIQVNTAQSSKIKNFLSDKGYPEAEYIIGEGMETVYINSPDAQASLMLLFSESLNHYTRTTRGFVEACLRDEVRSKEHPNGRVYIKLSTDGVAFYKQNLDPNSSVFSLDDPKGFLHSDDLSVEPSATYKINGRINRRFAAVAPGIDKRIPSELEMNVLDGAESVVSIPITEDQILGCSEVVEFNQPSFKKGKGKYSGSTGVSTPKRDCLDVVCSLGSNLVYLRMDPEVAQHLDNLKKSMEQEK